jgi:drug/metabolite transporter (DMT)-like permease
MTHVSLFGGGVATLLLPFVAVPIAAAWPWLVASVLLHVVYRFALIGAYRAGDMAQVYPIMRGAAPMMTAIGTALLIGEVLAPVGFLAVTLLSTGVFLMSFKGGRAGGLDRRAVLFALVSAASTCGYTVVDGIGGRTNGSGVGYALWLAAVNAATMQAIALGLRGPAVYAGLGRDWPKALGGGVMAMSGYLIAIWAMTKAPIALVAALRETSVLFGAAIAVLVLKEPLGRWRLLASASILAGVAMLRLA